MAYSLSYPVLPHPVNASAADTGRFSSSLNFTARAAAAAVPHGPAPLRTRSPDARHRHCRILANDLLGRHPGGQAIQDHAHRHPGAGQHRLPVHHLRVGGDHLQLLGRDTPSVPAQSRHRDHRHANRGDLAPVPPDLDAAACNRCRVNSVPLSDERSPAPDRGDLALAASTRMARPAVSWTRCRPRPVRPPSAGLLRQPLATVDTFPQVIGTARYGGLGPLGMLP